MLTTTQCWISCLGTTRLILSRSSLPQVMANATVGNVNATLATSGTTVTVPQRRRPVFQRMGRCAVVEETVFAAAVSVLNQGPLETPVKNVRPALMPVTLKGEIRNSFLMHDNDKAIQRARNTF